MARHFPSVYVTTQAVGAAVSLCLLAATCFIAGPAIAAPATYALPACYGTDTLPTERPNQVQFQTCADGSKELTGLTWTAWGAVGANGTGTFSYQVCEPNCAAGHRVSFPAVVHADEPQAVDPASGCPVGTLFYDNLVIAFPGGVPDRAGAPTNLRYHGLPAVLYSTEGDQSSATSLGAVSC